MQVKSYKVLLGIVLFLWITFGIIQLLFPNSGPKVMNEIMYMTNSVFIIMPAVGVVGLLQGSPELLGIFQAGIVVELLISTFAMILIILKLGTITFYVALTIAADLIFVPIGYYLTHNLLLLMEKEKKESSKVKDIV